MTKETKMPEGKKIDTTENKAATQFPVPRVWVPIVKTVKELEAMMYRVPGCQRGKVHSPEWAEAFIPTMLEEGVAIAPLLMADCKDTRIAPTVAESGYWLMDGLQRSTAIVENLNGLREYLAELKAKTEQAVKKSAETEAKTKAAKTDNEKALAKAEELKAAAELCEVKEHADYVQAAVEYMENYPITILVETTRDYAEIFHLFDIYNRNNKMTNGERAVANLEEEQLEHQKDWFELADALKMPYKANMHAGDLARGLSQIASSMTLAKDDPERFALSSTGGNITKYVGKFAKQEHPSNYPIIGEAVKGFAALAPEVKTKFWALNKIIPIVWGVALAEEKRLAYQSAIKAAEAPDSKTKVKPVAVPAITAEGVTKFLLKWTQGNTNKQPVIVKASKTKTEKETVSTAVAWSDNGTSHKVIARKAQTMMYDLLTYLAGGDANEGKASGLENAEKFVKAK